MRSPRHSIRAVPLFVATLLGACGDGSTDSTPPPPPTYSISGSIIAAGADVPVLVVGPDSQTVTTDAAGSFVASKLRPGTYTVTPAEPGYLFEPVEITVTLSADVTGQAFTRIQPTEAVGVSDIAWIDAAPERSLPADSVILPNGQSLSAYILARGLPQDPNGGLNGIRSFLDAQAAPTPPTGPQQRKNDIVAMMVASARDFACARRPVPCTKWNLPADPANPGLRPAQTGLTYIWGGKRPTMRTRGSDRCRYETYGMDCSGLVSRIAEAAGITAPEGSGNQGNAAQWKFPEAWQLEMKEVTDGIQTGDILAWPGHIGIAESSGSGLSVNVISSTGIPNECEKNIQPPRGPRSLSIAALGLGSPRVLRLVTTLSGDFDLYIRCTQQSTDAAVIRFTIDNDNGGPFRATGSGIDYDGRPLSFVLEGTYNQDTNVLDALLSLADGSRVDRINVPLLEDDTGYFPLTKVVNNGGCDGSARLVRVNTPAAREAAARWRLRDPAVRATTGPRLGGPPRDR
jgi:hypothetical protein